MRGPIDYIIIGFDGNKFDGSILNALTDAIDSGVIALVSLAMVVKDDKGVVTELALADIGEEIVAVANKYKVDDSKVTPEDIQEVGELLENNTAAGMLFVEQLWAKPLKKALIDANGLLIAEGRIHPEAALELED